MSALAVRGAVKVPVFVAGAGVSVDAGMPDSRGLFAAFERRLGADLRLWGEYGRLRARLVEEAETRVALDAPGTSREIPAENQINVQHLVDEIRNPSGVFAGSPALADEFIRAVMGMIRDELTLKDRRLARYFRALVTLFNALGMPLHVFTLNFDPCFESLSSPDFRMEAGFGGVGPNFPWDFSRFTDPRVAVALFLCKMHGSLDWRKTKEGRIYTVGPEEQDGIEDAVVVLGQEPKRRGEFPEPYERYREWFMERAEFAGRVIVIGYGFGDAGINDMLARFVNGGACDRLTVVAKADAGAERAEQESRVRDLLGGSGDVRFLWMSAKNLSRAYRVADAGLGAVGLGGWFHRRLGLAGVAGE